MEHSLEKYLKVKGALLKINEICPIFTEHEQSRKTWFRNSYQTIYTSANENFEYDYPHSDSLLQFCLKLIQIGVLQAA